MGLAQRAWSPSLGIICGRSSCRMISFTFLFRNKWTSSMESPSFLTSKPVCGIFLFLTLWGKMSLADVPVILEDWESQMSCRGWLGSLLGSPVAMWPVVKEEEQLGITFGNWLHSCGQKPRKPVCWEPSLTNCTEYFPLKQNLEQRGLDKSVFCLNKSWETLVLV